MIPDYNEPVYRELSKLVKLNFKSQIKNSGLELKQMYKMTDLISDEEEYLLITNDGQLRFTDQTGFINSFIILLKRNIQKFNEDFKELRRQESQDAIVDDYAIYAQDELIGHCGHKQLELLNKMREFRDNQK